MCAPTLCNDCDNRLLGTRSARESVKVENGQHWVCVSFLFALTDSIRLSQDGMSAFSCLCSVFLLLMSICQKVKMFRSFALGLMFRQGTERSLVPTYERGMLVETRRLTGLRIKQPDLTPHLKRTNHSFGFATEEAKGMARAVYE